METMKVTWKAGNCFSLCSWARTARKVDTRLSRWGGCHFHHDHSDLIIFVVKTMFFVGRIMIWIWQQQFLGKHWQWFWCYQLWGKVGVWVDELFVSLAEPGQREKTFNMKICSIIIVIKNHEHFHYHCQHDPYCHQIGEHHDDHLSAHPEDALKLGSSFFIRASP